MSPIANMLIEIKNAQSRNREEINVPFSNVKFAIAQVLKNKGLIGEVETKKKKGRKGELNFIRIGLKYDNGAGVISEIKMVSKPSRRVYAGKDELKPVRNGFGVSVVSTSKGIMAGDDARKARLGGEVICEIW
jgi:small subunit ribosomal protein S8